MHKQREARPILSPISMESSQMLPAVPTNLPRIKKASILDEPREMGKQRRENVVNNPRQQEEDNQILIRRFKIHEYGGYNGKELMDLHELRKQSEELRGVISVLNNRVERVYNKKMVKYLKNHKNEPEKDGEKENGERISPQPLLGDRNKAEKELKIELQKDRDRLELLRCQFQHLEEERSRFCRLLLSSNNKSIIRGHKQNCTKPLSLISYEAEYTAAIKMLQENMKETQNSIHSLKREIDIQSEAFMDPQNCFANKNMSSGKEADMGEVMRQIQFLKADIERKTGMAAKNKESIGVLEVKLEELKRRIATVESSWRKDRVKVVNSSTVPIREEGCKNTGGYQTLQSSKVEPFNDKADEDQVFEEHGIHQETLHSASIDPSRVVLEHLISQITPQATPEVTQQITAINQSQVLPVYQTPNKRSEESKREMEKQSNKTPNKKSATPERESPIKAVQEFYIYPSDQDERIALSNEERSVNAEKYEKLKARKKLLIKLRKSVQTRYKQIYTQKMKKIVQKEEQLHQLNALTQRIVGHNQDLTQFVVRICN